MKLRKDEEEKVIALIIPTPSSQLVFISARGYGKRIRLDRFRAQHRGGIGVRGMDLRKTTVDPGNAVAVRCLEGNEDLALITDNGTLVRIKAKEVRILKREARGVKVSRLKGKARLVDAVIIEKSDDEPQNRQPGQKTTAFLTAASMTISNRQRVYNFSPGPSMLPTEVVEQVREDLRPGATAATRPWKSATAAPTSPPCSKASRPTCAS